MIQNNPHSIDSIFYYGKIICPDIANGTGCRLSLFVSGCMHRCKGCFNIETWNYSYGTRFTEDTMKEILERLRPDYISGITLLGGEPLDNINRPHVLKESHPYLVDQLSFGFCAEDGETRSIEISLDSDELYVEVENGSNGLFVYERNAKIKRYKILDEECFSKKLNCLSIYKWPKAFPADYAPEKRFMGCDTGTWYLSYKELGGKTTRHINGKGAFPDSSPYIDLLRILNKVHPNQDLMEWVLSSK